MRIHTLFLLAIVAGFVLWEFVFVEEECAPNKQPNDAPYQTCFAYCKSIAPECKCSSPPPIEECPEPEECPYPDIPDCPSSMCPSSAPCDPCEKCIEKPNNEYPAGLWSIKRTSPRPVIDAFTLNHQYDWLEIRLNELKDVVDFFVLMEVQNVVGELVNVSYKERYPTIAEKIIYVDCTADNSSEYLDKDEQTSKCLQEGVEIAEQRLAEKNLVYQNSDLIIINSHQDVLLRPNMIYSWRWFDPMPPLPGAVSVRFHFYNFHWQIASDEAQEIWVTNLQFMLDNPETIWRGNSSSTLPERTFFNEGGWLCKNCLAPKDLLSKIQTSSEFSGNISDSIENGEDWISNSTYNFQPTKNLGDLPKYLLQNMDKFPYLVPISKYEKVKVLEASMNFLQGSNLWSTIAA